VQTKNSLTEGALSCIMNHPNIVRSLGYEAVVKQGPTEGGATHEIRLLMEFCDRGSLDKAVAGGCFHQEIGGMLQVHAHPLHVCIAPFQTPSYGWCGHLTFSSAAGEHASPPEDPD
jgi:hypothetical protein